MTQFWILDFGFSIGRSKSASAFSIALGALLFALCASADAQQSDSIRRIGFLANASVKARMERFREGLRDLGYVEGRNLIIDYRVTEGETARLVNFAKELGRLNVSVIVAAGGSSTKAAHEATRSIPIVMTNVSDPVTAGFVTSLATPGGNITGLTTVAPVLGGKRLELLKEVVPRLSRVAILDSPGRTEQLREIEAAADAFGVQVQSIDLRGADDLERAFLSMRKERADAFMALQDPVLTFNRRRIVALASKNRLPAVYYDGEFVEVGGLMSYAPDIPDLYGRAAIYVDKILRGAKPADLPVEQPNKFELVINLKTAKQIGLLIPPNVLARADKVIR